MQSVDVSAADASESTARAKSNRVGKTEETTSHCASLRRESNISLGELLSADAVTDFGVDIMDFREHHSLPEIVPSINNDMAPLSVDNRNSAGTLPLEAAYAPLGNNPSAGQLLDRSSIYSIGSITSFQLPSDGVKDDVTSVLTDWEGEALVSQDVVEGGGGDNTDDGLSTIQRAQI